VAELISRTETIVSPWVRLVAKEVRFQPGQAAQVYHCVGVADYVAILAVTHGGRIPLVGQYRPAVEAYTWELPSGLIDPGESPQTACRRELLEETGIVAEDVRYLGDYYSDTGRIQNRLHAFLVKGRDPAASFVKEEGLEIRYVDVAGLQAAVRNGEFKHQLHLGVLAAASVDHFRLDL